MAPNLSNEAWAQIRSDYEHTERPIADICAEHGISSGTLRDRMRRWDWTRRRAPIPREGPPPLPAPAIAIAAVPSPAVHAVDMTAPPAALTREADSTPAPLAVVATVALATSCAGAMPHAAAGDDASAPCAPDDIAIVPRLQSAVARVLPAIEATLARLTAGPTPPREMEQAARALSSLTRTLRELNGLLGQHRVPAADRDDGPEDIDEFRLELARRIHSFIDARTGKTDGNAEPQET